MSTPTSSGYVRPSSTLDLIGTLTLGQFVQTVLVGISGLPGPLVRPKFQVAPPKQPPEPTENWLAFALMEDTPDANAYLGMNSDGTAVEMQRHSDLRIECSFYGPRAQELTELVRDGFQIPQNRAALFKANMGFVETTRAFRLPELVNERWFDRFEMGIRLRKETQRTYPILSILSANGTISTVVGDEEWITNWQTPEE